jgi:hypothetical protein
MSLFSSCAAGYVPDGMTPEQYRKRCDKEANEKKSKKFGAFGPQSFKSRSLQSFQTELEKGKAQHLMPMFDSKKKLAQGTIKQKDIPYMQRQFGSWDDSDIGGKQEWNQKDKKYNPDPAFNWKEGPMKSQQPTKKGQQPAKQGQPPKKKLFGLF